MNKKIITISVSVMAIVIIALASVLTVVMLTPISRTDNKVSNDFTSEIQNTEHVVLTMGTATATASGGASKTLIATVLPETATNKAVDWSVTWGDESQTGNVTDYVTVIPETDGSNTAIVTCYKEFTGNIIVTATTRESGYTANCIVTYVGIPTEVSVSGEIAPVEGFYNLGIGNTYTFDIAQTNSIGSLSSEYNNITITLLGYGSIKVGKCYHYINSGVEDWYENTIKSITLDSIKDKFITASYSSGKLTITTKQSIESYYASKQKMDGGRTMAYTDKYKEMEGDCYFVVEICEQNSNIKKLMNIKFDKGAVTGINVNQPEITF